MNLIVGDLDYKPYCDGFEWEFNAAWKGEHFIVRGENITPRGLKELLDEATFLGTTFFALAGQRLGNWEFKMTLNKWEEWLLENGGMLSSEPRHPFVFSAHGPNLTPEYKICKLIQWAAVELPRMDFPILPVILALRRVSKPRAGFSKTPSLPPLGGASAPARGGTKRRW